MKGPPYFYVKFNVDNPFEAVECKRLICESLKTLFGEVGASKPFDLIQYCNQERSGILRIPSGWVVEIRSAIMLDSRFHLRRISSSALSLTADSRSYQHTKPASQQTRKRKRSLST